MQRRKFLASVGSLTAAGAAAMGTGAFSSVNANRNVTVNVADDTSAYLKLDDSPKYSTVTADGQLSLNLASLNEEATTGIRKAFKVKNQGTKPVAIHIDSEALNNQLDTYDSSDQIHFYVGVPNGKSLDVYDPDDLSVSGGSFDNQASENRILGVGGSIDVGLYVVNNGTDWNDVSADITISAYDAKTIANNDVGPSDS